MTILVLGASGKTGRSLVAQLLANGHNVRIIVRSTDNLPAEDLDHPNLEVIQAAMLELHPKQLVEHLRGCIAIVSCLGHNMNFRGIFGQPRRLCTDTVKRFCHAVKNCDNQSVKFILMSSVGVTSPADTRKRTWADRLLLMLLRNILPPHRDNEMAAQYFHDIIGTKHPHIEWCCVRPDSLIDAKISEYEVIKNPVTGITTGRPTTRSNVAKFMIELIENSEIWNKWKYEMPVIMNVPALKYTENLQS